MTGQQKYGFPAADLRVRDEQAGFVCSSRTRRSAAEVCCAVLFVLLLALFTQSACAAATDLADGEAAVEAAGDGLRGQWGTPWYDRSADDFKPLDLPPPKPRKPWKIWQTISNWLAGWNFDVAGFFELLMWLVLGAMICVAIYVLYKAVQNIEQREINDTENEELARSHIERVEALPVNVGRKVTDFYAETRRLRSKGDYAGAIVYLFGHQLIELDRRHLLRLVKGKTNRQYLRELRASGGGQRLAEILQETVYLFERSFFGANPPSEQEFEQVWSSMQEFDTLLAANAKEAA